MQDIEPPYKFIEVGPLGLFDFVEQRLMAKSVDVDGRESGCGE